MKRGRESSENTLLMKKHSIKENEDNTVNDMINGIRAITINSNSEKGINIPKILSLQPQPQDISDVFTDLPFEDEKNIYNENNSSILGTESVLEYIENPPLPPPPEINVHSTELVHYQYMEDSQQKRQRIGEGVPCLPCLKPDSPNVVDKTRDPSQLFKLSEKAEPNCRVLLRYKKKFAPFDRLNDDVLIHICGFLNAFDYKQYVIFLSGFFFLQI